MTADPFDRWPDLDEIFARVVELSIEDRERALDETGRSDPELRTELERLLDAHAHPMTFLEPPSSSAGDREPPTTSSLNVGDRLARYEITAKLGEGGMGEVWRAHDTTLERPVALKVMTVPLGEEHARRRLVHEARSASRLSHPNICTVYEVGDAEGRPFVAMEYVEGRTLDDLIPAGGMAVETAIGYGRQIAEALACAHADGVVHRDLKGTNVIVTPQGRPKILDFGIAQRMEPEEVETLTQSVATLEQAGSVAGTLPYMAPETLRGETADARADIWALGVLLQEMVSGRRPFTGATAAELLSSILRDPPAAMPDDVPTGLRNVIRRCLAKEPAQRYERASEVSAALEALGAPASVAGSQGSTRGRRLGVYAGLAGVAALLVAVGTGVLPIGTGAPAGFDATAISSIAVLPLDNLSGDSAQEFFSDGMTDELINELARLGSMRVTSRTSSMQYKNRAMPLPEIARELGVDAVLEGSVRRSADRVRIIVQLRHGVTEEPIWVGDFDREPADVLLLQRDVAGAIAREIGGSLTNRQTAQLADRSTVDPEAHEAYLWGRQYWNRRTEADLLVARDFFLQAIDLDANYAPAHAGLADTYTMLGVYSQSPREMAELAKTAAHRAVQLDPESAQGYKALGYALFAFDWDWAGAEEALRQAVDLNPNDSAIRNWYATFLMTIGRTEEALIHITEGRELDPLAPVVTVGVGLVQMFRGRFDEAQSVLEDLVSKAPDFAPARLPLGQVYLLQGRTAAAIDQFETLVSMTPSAEGRAELARAYAAAGREEEAIAILNTLRDPPDDGTVAVGRAWFELGDPDQAFRYLRRAYDDHVIRMIQLRSPVFDPLRSDPRFQDLLSLMAFPDVEP